MFVIAASGLPIIAGAVLSALGLLYVLLRREGREEAEEGPEDGA